MPMIISPDSAWGKELARWNLPRNQFVRTSDDEIALDHQGLPMRGMNAVGFESHPKMMYRAHRLPNGKASVHELAPDPRYVTDQRDFEMQLLRLDAFNRECRRIVQSEDEERIAYGQGWRETQKEALDLYEAEQRAIAREAAEAAHQAQRMGRRAQQEFAAAEDATSEHVADVPAPPRRRRGRPPAGAGVPSGTSVAAVSDNAPEAPVHLPPARPPGPELIVTAEPPQPKPPPGPTPPSKPPPTPPRPPGRPRKRR